jgi:dihydropteroate synthase
VSSSSPHIWRLSRSCAWTLDRPRVLGILNITPDSFSDGGVHARAEDALRAAARMLELGADGLDIGGESTRPGASRISAEEQIARVIPVIRAVRTTLGNASAITIDTTLAAVAAAALDAGADAINDVSAGQDDPNMFALAAQRSCGIVLMHRLRPPAHDAYSTKYAAPPDYPRGVVESVREFLKQRSENARRSGIAPESILIDPGLGFGKSVEQNLELLRRTPALRGLGFPVLSALSRKSFTARAAGLPDDAPPASRVTASVALSVAHLLSGARVFRVHDVGEHVQALRAAWSLNADQ